jgi:hypothetical protein
MEPKDDKALLSLWKRAQEEYFATRTCSVLCDKCGGAITVVATGSAAWRMTCPCGRFNDTLRGL